MPDGAETSVTSFLVAMDAGDPAARERLWAAVYDELHGMASEMMRREPAGHTLQPTALIHEAYARLLGGEKLQQRSRAYFFGAAAQAMRRILIEHARKHAPRKSASVGGFPLESLTASTFSHTREGVEALDQALDALSEHDRQVFDVIMLRFFTGLTVDQTSDVLGISPRTVKRNWVYGRTWLYQRVGGAGEAPAEDSST
ncbi:MAG: sigma-70 family RNA polymerase sigma factor [Phycisphaerales bacterium]|nr:sigma-70 family RNA polymerase sigma factor [Phycisphaerae bacterium]NNF43608.1 sigma-70 family RNA polymerase sigma factor [Phycisphaerales bacterium]NNM24929.1 sigma-70 family RNA polymerase sigma factor [Phycisphaerales bacterium]